MKNLFKTEEDKQYQLACGIFLVEICFLMVFRLVLGLAVTGLSDVAADFVWTLTLQLGIFILLPFALYTFVLKKKPREFLQSTFFHKPKLWLVGLSFVMGFFLLGAAMGFSTLWQIFLTNMGYVSSGGSGEAVDQTVPVLLMGLFLTGIMPALGEEVVCRGVYLGSLERKNGFWWAVVGSALMFGLGHVYIDQIFYAFLLGILSGYMTLKFRNIWPAIIIHFMNNSMSVYLSFAEQNGTLGAAYMQWIYSLLTIEGILLLIGIWLACVGAILVVLHFMKKIFKAQQDKQTQAKEQEQKLSAPQEIAMEEQAPQQELQKTPEELIDEAIKQGKKVTYYDYPAFVPPQGFVMVRQPYIHEPQKVIKRKSARLMLAENALLIGGLVAAIFGTLTSLIGGIL